MKKKEFYAHGKLLISGEYAVLDGSTGFSIPTKFGQRLSITSKNNSHFRLDWKSFDVNNKAWIAYTYPTQNPSSNKEKMLHSIFEDLSKNHSLFKEKRAFYAQTDLEFPQQWGLGSSSTFIYLLASWLKIDPYNLLEKTFGGSGYDIAAAENDLPVLYNKNTERKAQPIALNYSFTKNLFFVYLGKKKNSREAIRHYSTQKSTAIFLKQVSEISEQFTKVRDLQDFQELMVVHEKLLSKRLKTESIQQTIFNDLDGAVKSLGAWGGDFALIATEMQEESLKRYLLGKNMDIVFNWNDMIYKS